MNLNTYTLALHGLSWHYGLPSIGGRIAVEGGCVMVRYEIRHSLTATLQVLRWCAEKRDTYMFIGPRVVVGDVQSGVCLPF